MSDSLSSADRDARIAEIELRASSMLIRGDDYAWLIAELRGSLSREEEAARIMVPLRAMRDAEAVLKKEMAEASNRGRLTSYGELPSWPIYSETCDRWTAAMNAFDAARSVSLSENG